MKAKTTFQLNNISKTIPRCSKVTIPPTSYSTHPIVSPVGRLGHQPAAGAHTATSRADRYPTFGNDVENKVHEEVSRGCERWAQCNKQVRRVHGIKTPWGVVQPVQLIRNRQCPHAAVYLPSVRLGTGHCAETTIEVFAPQYVLYGAWQVYSM